MICPTCKGEKEQLALFTISETKPHELAKKITCLRCNGQGTVPDEQKEWIAIGKEMTKTRRSNKKTIREMSLKLGIEATSLSNIEQGQIKPDQSLYA